MECACPLPEVGEGDSALHVRSLIQLGALPTPRSERRHAPEQQSRLGSFSSRVDVPPPEGFQPLASYKNANNYREFMTNDKLVADLRKRFEGYTGPPINKGGVR